MHIPADRTRALWRRQAWLTALLAVSFSIVALLSTRVIDAYDDAVARKRLSLPAPDHSSLFAALVIAAIALVALLAAVCLHAYRIAALTLRRGDDH